MARTSQSDPADKFRFLVTIFQPSTAFLAVNGSGSLGSTGAQPVVNTSLASVGTVAGRSGFKEVTLPEVKVTTIKYRENIDGLSSRKIAGLAEYMPVTFKRGTMSETELFTMFSYTDNEASALNIFSSALSLGFGALPFQSSRYRKDILISSIDRSGNYVKHWYLSNAFVTGYKGGNDFDASSEEKLIEEITFDYEFFIEVLGDSVNAAIANVSTLAAQAALQQAADKLATTAVGFGASFIPF